MPLRAYFTSAVALTCLSILTPALFGKSATMSFTLAIGFDRLIKAAFPTFFNRNYKLSFYYMAGLVVACVSYGLYITYGCVSSTIASPKLDGYVRCTTPDTYGNMSNLIIRHDIILNFLIALCYIFVWIVIKRQRVLANIEYEAATRRLFKSLSVTVLVSFCGSFIYSVWTLTVMYVVRLPAETTLACGLALSIIIVASSASYAPVLYVFSKEYKRAFQSHFWAMGKALRLSASHFAMAQTPVVTPRMVKSPSGQPTARQSKISIAVSPFEIPVKPA
ncbi:serpentine type 7TM GPCR chemoreceptor srsx domain-containing protein [Ditylenchus destructor]|nr:serpentine type 7TM GPCR chemoreceptor srsx domain-containing protein [Ditylenchus destructor]